MAPYPRIKKKILILIHENDEGFFTYPPFISLLMKEWERNGFIVEVVRGIKHFVEADVVIPHIDLTVIPDRYIRFLDNYPVVVNRHIIDISKSRISSNIVTPSDPYEGPVIIKTDRNYGGLPEKRLLLKKAFFYSILSKFYTKKALFTLKHLISQKNFDFLDPFNYPVYQSLKDVPPKVFLNKNLVVEKFVPEIDDEYYCVRRWFFFGNKGVNVISRSKDRIIKASNTVSREESPTSEELYSIRLYLMFEYGKFDYTIHDGRVALFDVNKTIGLGGHSPNEFVLKTAKMLAEGIWSFL